jgi:hypothetical protein
MEPFSQTHIQAWRKALRVHAVMNHSDFSRGGPRLPGVEIPKVPRYCERRVSQGIRGATQKSLAKGQALEHLDFIPVFAVDRHGYAGQPGRKDRLDCTPVPRMDDVGLVPTHDLCQSKNGELKIPIVLTCNESLTFDHRHARKRWIASSYSANAVLEESLVEARHHVQQGVLGPAHPDPVHYLQDAQRLCFLAIAAALHGWRLLCFHFIASLRCSHWDLVFVREISRFLASSTRKLGPMETTSQWAVQ